MANCQLTKGEIPEQKLGVGDLCTSEEWKQLWGGGVFEFESHRKEKRQKQREGEGGKGRRRKRELCRLKSKAILA